MEKIISDLQHFGFLETKRINGEDILHIASPCVFKIQSTVVKSLKKNYLPNEEIGGVLWAKPIMQNNERVYVIDNVSYVRNAIEDNTRKEGINKTNAYLPDLKQLNQELDRIFNSLYLPVKFHSHPTEDIETLESLTNPYFQTETSEQDVKESLYPLNVESKKILMPRCLIVGNSVLKSDVFIGVYNGFIAPTEFEASKRRIIDENIRKTADYISSVNLTKGQKIGLGIGAALFLFTIFKYPKYSLPVIIGLTATLPTLLTNTQNIDRPKYFNRLLIGDAYIYIP